jgi:hypothetical protein
MVNFFLFPGYTQGKAQGPLAQLVEQLTFNQWVAGSIPARPTIFHRWLLFSEFLLYLLIEVELLDLSQRISVTI